MGNKNNASMVKGKEQGEMTQNWQNKTMKELL